METRRRNLIVLGSAAAVSLLLAAFALEQRAAEGQPHYTPVEVLPGFAAAVQNAAQIHVSAKGGAFDVVNTPKGWVVSQRGNYPADFDQVRHTLIGMATLQTIAPKTGRAEWLHYLALDLPTPANANNGGAGTQITVKNKDGAVLGDIITGNTEDLGDPNGTQGLFVRRPGSNQAFLARTAYVPKGDIATWLSAKVLTLGGTRIQEVVVAPLKGPQFKISRNSTADQIYTMANAPKKGSANSKMINSIPFAIANFSFADVKQAVPADFAKPVKVVARTFDGLLISLDVIKDGTDVWTRISASGAPGSKPEIAQQASAINDRANGFAFKLPPEKGEALLVDQDKIMTPLPVQQQPGGIPQFNMDALRGGATP